MIGVIGAGAFGTALSIALARDGRAVSLWARRVDHVNAMRASGRNDAHLPDFNLEENVTVTAEFSDLALAQFLLVAVPMQSVATLLGGLPPGMAAQRIVACCKGIDLTTLQGPAALIQTLCPKAQVAILTGPSFAADIARELPTALTLACDDDKTGEALQQQLSTPTLRLYRTTDVTGAELGGALKNVIAIAAGVVIGAGLGESARAALMTRGYAEMVRLAQLLGARPETLSGLSGLGDLVLTCTSDQSRNFRFGQALGTGRTFDAAMTVEGVATAKAVSVLAERRGIEMPVAAMVAALVSGQTSLPDAIRALLSRPLRQEGD